MRTDMRQIKNTPYISYWRKRRHVALLLCLVAVTAFRSVPGLGAWYTDSIYPLVCGTVPRLTGMVPFAVGDVFIAMSVAWVVLYPIYAIVKRRKAKGRVMAQATEWVLWVYVWFYAAWGLNYAQPDIYHRAHLLPAQVDKRSFQRFAQAYADSLNATYTPDSAFLRTRSEACIRASYIKIGNAEAGMGISVPYEYFPPAKTMVFSRLSSMAGVWGSMGPFFCEYTLNADLQPHEYAATYAHELSHLMGIANEGEANFYSYVTCTMATDRATRFSGYYHLLPHVSGHVRELLGARAEASFIQRLRPEIVRMARHDRAYWLGRRCPWVDKAQNALYELYLHGNHVEGGLQSYAGVVGIVMAWQARGLTSSAPAHR